MKLLKLFHSYFSITLILFLSTGTAAYTQLKADFIPDKQGGCSPLVVSFANTTTGASANATYEWDFGNSNSSVIKNPSASFYIENAYTVILTVKDGQNTSIQTKTITVYKRPSVDFTVSAEKGCLPFMASFNNTSVAGDGSIAYSYWDFGDGSTQQSNSLLTNHIYSFQQTASITLTVANSYGCTNTITKKDFVKVLPSISANFSAEKTIYCQVTDEVKFTNNSTGPGTLSYEWDFGDGSTSTIKTPSHIYNKKGTYTVKLTLKSSEGCTDVLTRTSYLNIADFNSDFETQPVLCANTTVTFANKSTPVPDNSVWSIDGTDFYSNYGNGSAYLLAYTTGIHTIQLINNFGGCRQTVSKQVDIKPAFDVRGFVADMQSICGSPVKVNFKDTTTGAVKWKWDFGDGAVSADKEPIHTYTRDDLFTVTLTAFNAAGCSQTVNKAVYISKPLVGIFPTDAAGDISCGTITKSFMARSTEVITNYKWDFGDGAVSADKEPTHTYTAPGSYTVKLSYTITNGCTGVAVYDNPIAVRKKIVADFTGPKSVCGNKPVTFNSTSTGDIATITWDYGDNSPGYGFYNTHKFTAEGDYTIKMIATNFGCADTVEKKGYIHVSPPFTTIAGVSNTCDGNRSTVTFSDGSEQAQTYKWDFGDGSNTSYTASTPTITHSYAKSGRYKVVLTTTNAGCTVKDSVTAYVLLKQQPLLSSTSSIACVNSGFPIKVSNLERPQVAYPFDETDIYPPYTYTLQHTDGSSFDGYISGSAASLPWNGTITPLTRGQETIRAIVIDNPFFGCTDTSNTIQLDIKGPVAALKVVSDNVCFKSYAMFQDMSQAGNNVPIVNWAWDFGDGMSVSGTAGNSVGHLYLQPGYYYATLSVTDKDGCTSITNAYQNAVAITGPKAAFTPSGTNVPLNTTVTFSNNTNSYNSNNTQYKWNFGDGVTSSLFSPSHTYPVAGNYTVQLIATNPLSQCSDTVTQVITVRNFNTAFSISASFIGNSGHCAPALASFTNTSSNFTNIIWDFGDGFTLENQNSPSHIYKQPGKYIVTLFVYGFNGLSGTYKDSILISEPAANIKTDITEGCVGTQVTLHSTSHSNTPSYSWDFGNGTVINSSDSFALNKYMSAGTYYPSLIVTDMNGCSASVALNNPISISPAPVIDIIPADPVLCKGKSIQLKANGGVSYIWSPAYGLDNINSSSPVASPGVNTTYSVDATDAKGCVGNNNVTVVVAQPFTIQSSPDASICAGSSIQLNTKGTDNYKWINETAGLNNTQIANPVASPLSTINYTVVGYDQYQCFTDTAHVKITVNPLPTVEAGQDMEIIIGSEVKLTPSTSSDVIKWDWSPADYLSCRDCSSPVSKPRSPVDYTITVQNQFNCIGKDNIKINTICAGGQIYIPSAFSPNNDGKNDRFVILGNGVRVVKSLRIYNRWGNLVFERRDFYPDDNSSAWDGNYKGLESPAGTYVYIAEMECNANETFTRKGTITLLR